MAEESRSGRKRGREGKEGGREGEREKGVHTRPFEVPRKVILDQSF